MEKREIGNSLYRLAQEIFPIYRSITGEGVRATLQHLKRLIPELEIHEVASGTKAYDWVVPEEWNIKEAYIEDEKGKRIIDFRENNLHVVGYSQPIDKWVTKKELRQYIYTQPDQPEVIPYITSYYSPRIGFCMSEEMWESLPDSNYHMYIESSFSEGSMTYGEVVIPGKSLDEICFSTNICHPGLGSNEVSGPCVLTYLAKWLLEQKNRRYTYRILMIPETIGSITYISQHLNQMKQNIKAGFVVTCVGDDLAYSYVESRTGETLADRALEQVLKYYAPDYKKYSFLERGSDERQYCSPGVDLPFAVFSRSKFHEYKEYHTSADNLSFISPEGMGNALEVLKRVVIALEYNKYYKTTVLCEPQLGKRGLYPTVSQKGTYDNIRVIQNFLAYADGKSDLIEISEKLKESVEKLVDVIERLLEEELIEEIQ
ncbi:MAG: DUF4910 domain-containing protein [Lachnospiraceae bacterium]|nr:DUF4910 domain-containing protein [Lachnospiraceae bacterium]MDY5521453.1 DUF4910 domain-containing protein [Agathobacter sp.]